MRTLKYQTLHLFRDTLIELTTAAGISTKTAAELATKLAIGFISPIVSQIDPIRLGEIQRTIRIALAYGERLISKRGNLNSTEELAILIQEYPDHKFVIDYQEAEKIFKKIRNADNDETILGESLKNYVKLSKIDGSIIVSKIYPSEIQNEQINQQTNHEGSRKDKRKAGEASTGNSGTFTQIETRTESIN